MNNPSLLYLLTISNPNLPIGGFTYSQGIESAIEYGWIKNTDDAYDWILSQLKTNIKYTDIVMLWQLNSAYHKQDIELCKNLSQILLACRESKELRDEELCRGKAFVSILENLNLEINEKLLDLVAKNHLLGYIIYAYHFHIPIQDLSFSYAWNWLESQVLAVVKILPLGQSSGQLLLHKLLESVADILQDIAEIDISKVGYSQFSLAVISSKHEYQYSRIFRS